LTAFSNSALGLPSLVERDLRRLVLLLLERPGQPAQDLSILAHTAQTSKTNLSLATLALTVVQSIVGVSEIVLRVECFSVSGS
jgi:hypothetical protein